MCGSLFGAGSLSRLCATKSPAPPRKGKGGSKPGKSRQGFEKHQVQLEALNFASKKGESVDSRSRSDSEADLLGHSVAHEQRKGTKGDNRPAEVTVVRKTSVKRKIKPRLQLKGTLYDYPKYYDWAVAYRDYEMEVRIGSLHLAHVCNRDSST
jgi:hypothetical protein